VNQDRRYVYANNAYAGMLDLPSSNIVGLRVSDVLPEIYEEQIGPRLDRAFAGKRVDYELHKLTADGDCHYEIRYEPTLVNGTVTLVVVVVTDITERKRAELASLRLAAIVEYSDDAIIGKNLDSIITSWNQGAEKIFGYTAAEMVGNSIMRLIPNDRREEENQILKKIRRGESVNHFETLRQTKDGRLIDVSVTASPIKDAAGVPIGVSKVARDITGRKRAEQRLVLLDICISKLNDIVLITEADLIDEPGPRIVFVNDAFTRLTGYTSAEVLGRNPRFLQGEKTDRSVLKEIREALAQQQPIRRQILNYGKDGTEYWLDMDIVPILDAAGKCTHFAAIERDITEAKNAEARYRTLFEHAPDGIVIADSESTYLDANASMCRMLGYTRDELIGLNARDIVVQAEIPQIEPAISAIKASSDYHREWQFRRKDGSTFDAEVIATLMPDGNLLGMIRDITERKLTEKALYKERDFSSAVVDTVGSLVVVLDRQARIVRFNRACEQLTGYSFEEVKDRNIIDLVIMPEEQITTKAEFANLCAGQFPNTFENHWVTREGKARVIAWSNTALVDADGAVEHVIGTGTDITERKRAEEQIAEQAAFLDKAQDAILVRDLEGKILFWNHGAERIYGWMRQEVVGRNIGGLLYTNPKKFEEVNGLTIRQGEWHGELQHLTKERGEITIEARWTLIRDNEGQPKSILAINTDITEKKKIEAQFMRAQRMESIGTLAGGIAHDLNNILAPIMMSIDILKSMSENPQAMKILETIEISAKRGADIVRQVLSFARGLEGERVEIQPKHLLKDLENIIKDTFPKDIQLRFSIPNDIWTILGDPTQIHQILLNLSVNARDAMPNGGSLTVGVENFVLDEQYAAMNIQAKPGRYVTITVSDSGTGIPQNLLEKIFEPFFTTKELNKGTGLGLSTVMAIVKSHGGIINVYSEPGKGTSFNVYLPAIETSSEMRHDAAELVSLPRGNGEMVLVVDDEASILTITSQTLQAFGYRILTAKDGAEAVAVYAVHKNDIAVVLTDMMMPIMDGPATIHALIRINPSVKIVAASGLNANGNAAKMTEAGVKHFLTKPYTAGTLLKTMRAILDEA
jgi:PAS domain S-box-containing protein